MCMYKYNRREEKRREKSEERKSVDPLINRDFTVRRCRFRRVASSACGPLPASLFAAVVCRASYCQYLHPIVARRQQLALLVRSVRRCHKPWFLLLPGWTGGAVAVDGVVGGDVEVVAAGVGGLQASD